MPFGLAVVLWAIDLVPIRTPLATQAIELSTRDLARTAAALRGPADRQPGDRQGGTVSPIPAVARARAIDAPGPPPDLAFLIGQRRGGAQVEIGALGGGRADAPGLVHLGVGLDF